MTIFKQLSIATLCAAIVFSAGPASADPKPQGAKPLGAQSLANLYAGTSHIWKSCKGGGIYYGGKFEALSYCNKNGPSVGIGKWSVDRKGRLCYDLTHYWPKGDGYGSKPQDKEECIAHVLDADGQIWRKWGDDTDWWRFNPKDVIKGFKFKRKVNKLRKKLGV